MPLRIGRPTYAGLSALGRSLLLVVPRACRRVLVLTVMSELAARWESFKDERGASMVEYALLVVLIAIIAILAITFAGNQVSETFSDIGSALNQ
jgi:pilus assembly protein Flp/PilA